MGSDVLALQVTELALDDDLGQFPLFLAVEERQVAFQEASQAAAAAADVGSGDLGIGEQRLGPGALRQ